MGNYFYGYDHLALLRHERDRRSQEEAFDHIKDLLKQSKAVNTPLKNREFLMPLNMAIPPEVLSTLPAFPIENLDIRAVKDSFNGDEDKFMAWRLTNKIWINTNYECMHISKLNNGHLKNIREGLIAAHREARATKFGIPFKWMYNWIVTIRSELNNRV